MTNSDRRISAAKQLRQIKRKEDKHLARLNKQMESTPRKIAAPVLRNTPLGFRTVMFTPQGNFEENQ